MYQLSFEIVSLKYEELSASFNHYLNESTIKYNKVVVSFKSQMNFNSTRFGLVYHNLDVIVVVDVFLILFNFFSTVLNILI